MSADNGYVIRKRDDDKYTMQMYFMSNDAYPPIADAKDNQVFDSIEEAVNTYDEMRDSEYFVCEYGLTVDIPRG